MSVLKGYIKAERGDVFAIYYIAKDSKLSTMFVYDTLAEAEKKLAILEKREDRGELEFLDDIKQIPYSQKNSYQKEMDKQFGYFFKR